METVILLSFSFSEKDMGNLSIHNTDTIKRNILPKVGYK